ncbi:MAG: hypothetical protein ABIZ36_08200 [Gemmatimonadaceae bacterium]
MRPQSEKELAELPSTLAWAIKHDLTSVLELVLSLVPYPLIVVAPGDFIAAGHFVARLHNSLVHLPVVVLTPYQFILQPGDDVSGVLLLSAEGSNPDMLAAARHASEASHPALGAIIGCVDSPLSSQLCDCRRALRAELELPPTASGMNSLLATITLLSRAYDSVFGETGTEAEVPIPSKGFDGPALDRPLFNVLAAGWSSPAAQYFESKCNESAFGAAVFTDYRNFTHGWQTGLARRAGETTVVAFVSPDCHAVATNTLEFLPKSVPTIVVDTTKPGSSGAIELLLATFELSARISARAQLDACWPSDNTVARNLFPMDISTNHRGQAPPDVRRKERIDHWIRRKVGSVAWGSATDVQHDVWHGEYEKWASVQRAANVGGIVFDYDGTICEADERFRHPGTAIATALVRLLDLGVTLGIASGRGHSVVDALRAVLPRDYWHRLVVGPYNGSFVMSLADPFPEGEAPAPLMSQAAKILKASPLIRAVADVTFAGTMQVTVMEIKPLPAGMLRRIVLETLASEPRLLEAVSAQSSGLTVDVLGLGASKRRVVDHIASQLRSSKAPEQSKVFAIGDQGSLDGNDFALLSDSHSLSVHNVSSLFDRCWNLARPGRRGSAAFIDYLDAIVPREAGGSTFAFDVDSLESA